MKAPVEGSKLLDRGRPTVRELLSSLVFNPADGTIRINGDRVVMQRAAVGVSLRRELIRVLGAEEARVFLIRLGFLSGQADARFVRTSWPSIDPGDAFTAGTRLHTFSGVVRVEPVYVDFDLRRNRYAGEFLWHDSVEAAEFRLQRPTPGPVCWTQLGYASGYASEFFDTLIVYKEVECTAQGHKHCRVVGKPADAWGVSDPDVTLFRDRIVATSDAPLPEPRKAAPRTAESAASELDRLILSPVRAELDRLAPMALPVMLVGSPGTGRSRAARYLHRASGAPGGELRQIFGCRCDLDLCADIARRGKGGRRGNTPETILIDAAEEIPAEMQPHLARAIEEGLLAGGPRILALVGCQSGRAGPPAGMSPELWYALSAATVNLPTLDTRDGDRAMIAEALLPVLAARMGRDSPGLEPAAAKLIERTRWPGNLRQMRAVLSGAMAAQPTGARIAREAVEAQLARFDTDRPNDTPAQEDGIASTVGRLLGADGFSLADFERTVYEAAVSLAGGNLSAAARLLGLTRPQLAYRLGDRARPR